MASIDGHKRVAFNNEGALLKAVANQPVSVAIEAGGPDFRFYSKVARIVGTYFWLMQIYLFIFLECDDRGFTQGNVTRTWTTGLQL